MIDWCYIQMCCHCRDGILSGKIWLFQKAGFHTLRPFMEVLPPVAVAGEAVEPAANFSFNTANLDRYSSMPMYAPHIRRLPSKAERP